MSTILGPQEVGTTVAYRLSLARVDGTTNFTGDANPSATLWRDDTNGIVGTPTVAWTSIGTGIATLTVTAPSPPRRYNLDINLTEGSSTFPVVTDTYLDVTSAPVAPPGTGTALVSSGDVTSLLPTSSSWLSASPTAQSLLIQAASQACELYCNRILKARAFDETHYPGRTRTIRLRNRPLISISRLMGGLTEALTIKVADGTKFDRATVSMNAVGEPPYISASGITLFSRKNALDTTTVLDFTTYTTVQSLVNAVNLVAGWNASTTASLATYATADLNLEWGSKGAYSTVPLYAYNTELSGYEVDERNAVLTLGAGWLFGALPMSYVPDTFRFPDRTWGASQRYGGVRVSYIGGPLSVDPLVQEACALVIASLLQQRDAAGSIRKASSGTDSIEFAPRATATLVRDATGGILDRFMRLYIA